MNCIFAQGNMYRIKNYPHAKDSQLSKKKHQVIWNASYLLTLTVVITKITCSTLANLPHMVCNDIWITWAVWPKLWIKAWADLIRWLVSSTNRITSRYFQLPVRQHRMIPVQVNAIICWIPIPGIVKNVYIVVWQSIFTDGEMSCSRLVNNNSFLSANHYHITVPNIAVIAFRYASMWTVP